MKLGVLFLKVALTENVLEERPSRTGLVDHMNLENPDPWDRRVIEGRQVALEMDVVRKVTQAVAIHLHVELKPALLRGPAGHLIECWARELVLTPGLFSNSEDLFGGTNESVAAAAAAIGFAVVTLVTGDHGANVDEEELPFVQALLRETWVAKVTQGVRSEANLCGVPDLSDAVLF